MRGTGGFKPPAFRFPHPLIPVPALYLVAPTSFAFFLLPYIALFFHFSLTSCHLGNPACCPFFSRLLPPASRLLPLFSPFLPAKKNIINIDKLVPAYLTVFGEKKLSSEILWMITCNKQLQIIPVNPLCTSADKKPTSESVWGSQRTKRPRGLERNPQAGREGKETGT